MKKNIVITGASRGIGAATALLSAERGYAVVVNYREHEQKAMEIVRKIHLLGGEAVAIGADISKEREVQELFGQAESHFGPVTALVNNAGVAVFKPVLQTSAQEWERVIAVNLTGLFVLSRLAAQPMQEGAISPPLYLRVARPSAAPIAGHAVHSVRPVNGAILHVARYPRVTRSANTSSPWTGASGACAGQENDTPRERSATRGATVSPVMRERSASTVESFTPPLEE